MHTAGINFVIQFKAFLSSAGGYRSNVLGFKKIVSGRKRISRRGMNKKYEDSSPSLRKGDDLRLRVYSLRYFRRIISMYLLEHMWHCVSINLQVSLHLFP